MSDEKRTALPAGSAALAVICGMFAAMSLILCVWLYQSYRVTERQLELSVVAASKIMATNARWINALAWQALNRIDQTLGEDIRRDSGHFEAIFEAVDELPGITHAYVVDKDGETIYSTDPNIKPINITDREYFSALKGGARRYLSSLLVSRLNGKQIFVFSLRLERGGAFAGAAIVSYEADMLKGLWESVSLGQNSTVGLIRKDGMLVARYPQPPGPVDMGDYILFTDYLSKAPSGTYYTTSPVDAEVRTVGYQTVEGTDFVAVASADTAAAMAPFWTSVYVAVAVLAFGAAGAATGGWWTRQLFRRDSEQAERLSVALEKNHLLMREIHHRVKNNMQAISALVRLQRLPDTVQDALLHRIRAMASVHEHIYSRDQFSNLSADELLRMVIDELVQAYRPQTRVVYDLEPILVSNDLATPLALLVNEVVTNSLKYAFPDPDRGTISIRLRSAGDERVSLSIADDGVGKDHDNAHAGMGTRLIKGVVAQLGGSFEYKVHEGTTFTAELNTGRQAAASEAA